MRDGKSEAGFAPQGGHMITTFKDRDAWARGVTGDLALNPIARLVAVRLSLFLNCATGRCNPAYATVAQEVGVHRSTAIRAVAALVARGWLAPTDSGGRHTNNFKLQLPAANGSTSATFEDNNSSGSATVDGGDGSSSVTPTVAPARLQQSHCCDPNSESNCEENSEGKIYTPRFNFDPTRQVNHLSRQKRSSVTRSRVFGPCTRAVSPEVRPATPSPKRSRAVPTPKRSSKERAAMARRGPERTRNSPRTLRRGYAPKDGWTSLPRVLADLLQSIRQVT